MENGVVDSWKVYLRVGLGMLALWLVSWGMWSWNVPYFADDLYYFKLRENVPLLTALRKMFVGEHFGVVGFERIAYGVYGYFGYRLSAGLHHFMTAFFHLVTAYLFWILLRRLRVTVLVSTFAAVVFLVFPVGHEAFLWTAAMIQPNFVFLMVTCLLFLNYRAKKAGWRKVIYGVVLNLFLFFLCLSHPLLVQSILFLVVLEMIVSAREGKELGSVLSSGLKTALVFVSAPALYLFLDMQFPHCRVPTFYGPTIWRNASSLATGFLPWLGPDRIRDGIEILKRVPSKAFICAAGFAVSFFLLGFNSDKGEVKSYSTRWLSWEIVGGLLWMVCGCFLLLFNPEALIVPSEYFANGSRYFYLPTLGFSVMTGGILMVGLKQLPQIEFWRILCWVFIGVLVLVDIGIVNHFPPY